MKISIGGTIILLGYVALNLVEIFGVPKFGKRLRRFPSQKYVMEEDKKRLDMTDEQRIEYDRQVAELRREIYRAQTRYEEAPDDMKADVLMEKVQLLEKLDELLCKTQVL